MTAVQELISRSIPEPNSGCWLWLGSAFTTSDGRMRPLFSMQGKQWLAHRASAWLHFGPFDLKAFICHRCDNPMCVNPDHLYVGDHASNMADMARRKRSFFARNTAYAQQAARALGTRNTWSRGQGNPKAKLSPASVEMIRRDPRPTKVVAAAFGVDRTTVQRIRRGSTWTSPFFTPNHKADRA